MTLLITVFAAIICTLIWYKNLPNNELRLGFLSLMFWGASLMWSVDAVFEYIEGYYYNQRLHEGLGYRTPREVEEEYFGVR